ncbi:MAG: ABC transporter permease [Flavobacteriales bacterium]
MFRFIVKKVIYGFVVLFGVVTTVFFLFNAKSTNPEYLLGGQNATKEVLDNIRKDLGLDLPVGKRYVLYLNDLSFISIHNAQDEESRFYLDKEKYDAMTLFSVGKGNVVVLKVPYLRQSYVTKRKVADVIIDKLPNTILLAVTAITIATFLGILLGIFATIYKGSFFDNSALVFAVLGMSAPSYVMAIVISWLGGVIWTEITYLPSFPFFLMIFGAILGYFVAKAKPSEKGKIDLSYIFSMAGKGLVLGIGIWLLASMINSFMNSDWVPLMSHFIQLPGTGLNITGALVIVDDYTGEDIYAWKNLILPAITLGIRPLAIVTQLMRSSLLDVLSQDYIRTAKAKGLAPFSVIMKHGLKNAMNPVVTAISGWFASLLAGSVFVERVFDFKGLGDEVVSALQNDDLPLVMGAVLVVATFFVIINILVDIAYGFLDPRIRIR